MQNFSYVMMCRQRGNQQFKLPHGISCKTGMRAREDLRTAVNAAKNGDLDLLEQAWRCMATGLRALYDLTDWFPDPRDEIIKIYDLLWHLYNQSRK